MIYDIIGLWDFKGPGCGSLDHVFLDHFYRRVHRQYKTFRSGNLRLDYYERGGGAIFDGDERTLVVIGEALLNENGAACQKDASLLLSARDIDALYRARGLKITGYIKGNYQLAVFDKVRGNIVIINSRSGVSPFYYQHSGREFVFSTSLAALQRYRRCGYDKIGVTEYALFGFPLGDRTYFEGVRCMRPATMITVTPQRATVSEYWNIRALFTNRVKTEDEALSAGCALFKKTVNAYAGGGSKICASLTGGFDGRAILSVLDKDPADILLYSFGIAGSENISIPSRICRETGYNFAPVYLDTSYERVYDEFAMQAVYQSDGLATLERANYPYAFMKLNGFSDVFLTGIFGSELMRTFQNIAVGSMISRNFVDLNYARDKKAVIRDLCRDLRTPRYYDPSMMSDEDTIIDHVYEECVARYSDIGDNERFFAFMLGESVRRYFGGEVHAERIHAVNRFPFLDDDFVDHVSASPFAGFRKNPLHPTIGDRYHSQYFYARLIKQYRPELLKYETDHGYPAGYVLARYPLLLIGPRYVARRIRRRLSNYQEFKTEEWTRGVYQNRLLKPRMIRGPLTPALVGDFETGAWLGNRLEFARAASLMVYFDMIGADRGTTGEDSLSAPGPSTH